MSLKDKIDTMIKVSSKNGNIESIVLTATQNKKLAQEILPQIGGRAMYYHGIRIILGKKIGIIISRPKPWGKWQPTL